MKSNIDDPNIHIKEYIENYLELKEPPEFAILLKGKWGSGKTYFIDNFIQNYNKQNKKFIKISLFGLKNTSSIDEEIFQNLHPLLGSKHAKLVGNLLKSAVKFNIDIDLNNDNKKDGKINIDLKDEFKLLDFFSDDKKSKEELVFIFDDLERTEINLKEVLGYINYLVEQSNFKVIIVANEEKIDSSFYKEFKEKVIGKTFEIKHDFKEVLNYFIEKKTDVSKEILKENTQIIEDIYRKAGYNNLRHIAQILLDFEYFIKKINEKYLKNKEFISILIKNFFAISIELKSGNLTKEELLKKEDQSSLDKKEKTAIEKIYEKYDVKRYLLFEGKEWVKILLDNSITKEELNNLIGDTIFFVKDKRLSWIKLWHYRKLSDKEFANIIEDVISKFKKCEYEIPDHFIHVIALLIFLGKINYVNLP